MQKRVLHEKASELQLATMFITQADKHQYGKLQEELQNNYIHSNDDYPSDLPHTNVVAFAKAERDKDKENGGSGGNNTNWHKTMMCHNCGKKGHIKSNCPEFDKDKDDKDDKADKDKKKKSESILSNKKHEKAVTFIKHESKSDDEMGFINLVSAQVNKLQVDLCDMVLWTTS
jgi:hypothetical protein